MKNVGVKYGLFYGIGASLLGLLAYFIDPKILFTYLDWQTILSIILLIGLMYWSAKVTKEQIEEATETVEAQMEGTNPFSIGNTLIGLLTTIAFQGLPLSAIIAAIVKKKRPDNI